MSLLIYGAYGYTGRLVARRAAEHGPEPILAGRDAQKLGTLARELELPHRAFALEDGTALREAVSEADLVLHCAGPFARTAHPMVEACLRAGTHYLDITGEIEVFEYVASQDARATEAGVMLMPGVGFDVVPTDCLAAYLKEKQPDAQYLELAVFMKGNLSGGTAATAAMNAGRGSAIRKSGRITHTPAAWRTRQVDFGRGATKVVSIPWGDVATAWHTTGIPNIITYAKLPRGAEHLMKAARYAGPLLRTRPVRRFLEAFARESAEGPDAAMRETGRSFVWGRARTAGSGAATARLSGPEAYALTARTALETAERALNGSVATGFQTPAGHFGADYILDFEGVRREDLSQAKRGSS
jgi:short subunit dehydrogenase-like uncharacterized protein